MVTFYEGDNFGGRRFAVEQPLPNFGAIRFNDRAQSAIVEGGGAGETAGCRVGVGADTLTGAGAGVGAGAALAGAGAGATLAGAGAGLEAVASLNAEIVMVSPP